MWVDWGQEESFISSRCVGSRNKSLLAKWQPEVIASLPVSVGQSCSEGVANLGRNLHRHMCVCR